MRYRIFFQFIIVLTILACSGANRPSGVLPRKKMVPILVDIHLAEAINNQKFNLAMTRDSLPEDLYLSICKKYHVERSVVENSLLWYGKNTRDYMPVYNEVLDVLSEMEVKAKGDTLKPARINGFDNDTVKTKKGLVPPAKTDAAVK